MGMGKAMKQMIGQVIMAKSTSLFATSIEQGVMALVALVTNPALAGGHAAAAAKAAAGAAALAVLARSLGVAGATPSVGAGASVGGFRGAGGIGGGAERTFNRTFIIGSQFGTSERVQAARLKRLLRDDSDTDETVSFG
jgi:hypothetical protein